MSIKRSVIVQDSSGLGAEADRREAIARLGALGREVEHELAVADSNRASGRVGESDVDLPFSVPELDFYRVRLSSLREAAAQLEAWERGGLPDDVA